MIWYASFARLLSLTMALHGGLLRRGDFLRMCQPTVVTANAGREISEARDVPQSRVRRRVIGDEGMEYSTMIWRLVWTEGGYRLRGGLGGDCGG
jgi:hypothetical protein